MSSILVYPDHYEVIPGAGDVKTLFPEGFEYLEICRGRDGRGQDGRSIGAYFSELPKGKVNTLLPRAIRIIWPGFEMPSIRGMMLINSTDSSGDDLPLNHIALLALIKVLDRCLKH